MVAKGERRVHLGSVFWPLRVCDVNRVQGVTSSQGRLLTSARMPKSAVGGSREDRKADREREMGGKGIRELKRYDIAYTSHLVQLVIS